MGRRTTRIMIKVTNPGSRPDLSAGEAIFFRNGSIEREGSTPILGELVAAAWPLIRDKELAFAAGDSTPASGRTESGIEFVVQPAVEEEPRVHRTRRFEKSAVEVAQSDGVGQTFLGRLPRSLVTSLRRVSIAQNYSPGQDVIKQGQAASSLFMVEKGEVEVVKIGEQEEAVLAILGPGDIFGEMSILTGDPTSATVRARSDCSIMALAKETLEELLVTHPILGREFSRLLADRMRRTSKTVEAELDRSIFGSLAMVDPADLVQTMSGSRRTGKLTLRRGQDTGDIYFDSGKLVGASFGTLRGVDAFNMLLHWREGRFTFEKGEFQVVGPLEGDTIGLLMEAMRLIDEETREFEVNDD